jgi:NADP-dependent 3-hydroxy acid dehydrogenase YdfG
MYFTMMKNLHEDEWERTVDINCKGTLNGVAAALQTMTPRNSGHIVNISSDAGRDVYSSLTVYCASKAFVVALSKGLRKELVGTNVRVRFFALTRTKTRGALDWTSVQHFGMAVGDRFPLSCPALAP